MNFDFLQSVELTAPETTKKATRTAAPKLPEGNCIRVFASGKVYPSKELVELLNLEYTNKGSETVGNGFDVFKSSDWQMFPANAPEQYIFVATVPKNSPKVSLFGSCGYDENGAPKTSVTEQGGGSFGKELVEMIASVYGITIEAGSYLDLEINTEVAVKSPTDVYFLPKVVSRGEKKGEISVVRRDSINVNPLVPVVSEETTEENTVVEEGDQETAMEQTAVETEENPLSDAPSMPGALETPTEEPQMPSMPSFPEV